MDGLIDSHAHLADEAFDDDRDAVLARAREAGVETIVVIGSDASTSRRAVRLAREVRDRPEGKTPTLAATAGIVPHVVEDVDEEELAAVRRRLRDEGVVAVGEIGLDYHYDLPRADQRDLLVRQLRWAREVGLPVVLHSRDAEEDMVELLREHLEALDGAGTSEDPGRPPGVVHCFTESAAMAESVLELGFLCSFSGILTFGNAADLRETAAAVPLERTLVETDSPYLAPEPHRGRRNEPAFVGAVAERLAEIHGRPVEEVARVTADNARRLFGLPRPG